MNLKSNNSILVTLFFTVIIFTSSAHAQQKATLILWHKIGADLEAAQLELPNSGIISDEIIFFRTSLERYKIEAITDKSGLRRDVKQFCDQRGGTLCLNANFFDEKGKALGLVMHDGKIINELHNGGSIINGILASSESGRLQIFTRNNFDIKNKKEAVQVGPLLIYKGIARPGVKKSLNESRRVGACIDKKDRLILFSSSNSLFGLTLLTLQGILLNPEIACRDAINFDGGGSAQIYVKNGNGLNLNSLNSKHLNAREYYEEGRDIVPVAIALIKK